VCFGAEGKLFLSLSAGIDLLSTLNSPCEQSLINLKKVYKAYGSPVNMWLYEFSRLVKLRSPNPTITSDMMFVTGWTRMGTCAHFIKSYLTSKICFCMCYDYTLMSKHECVCTCSRKY